MANKQIRLTSSNKMALRIAIKQYTKKKDWIMCGELSDILEKAERGKKE